MSLLFPDSFTPRSPLGFDRASLTSWEESEAQVRAVRDWIEQMAHLQSGLDGSIVLLPRTRRDTTLALLGIWAAGGCAVLAPRALDPSRSQLVLPELSDLSHATDTAPVEPRQFEWPDEKPLVSVVTSGTTGHPQSFPKSAGQLWGEARVLAETFGVDRDTRVVPTVVSHHLYGLLFGVLLPLCAGAPVCWDRDAEPERFHPGRVNQLVASLSARRDQPKSGLGTVLATVPAHVRSLLEAGGELPGVTRVISSASPLRRAWAEQLEAQTSCRVSDVLGSTETGGIALREPARDKSWTPLAGIEVSLDDEGRLCVHSPFALASSAGLTTEAHLATAGRFVTAERASILPDGRFDYLGRDDGVVKVGGKRISLADLEGLARSVSGVSDAVGLARETTRLRGNELWLAVESEDDPIRVRRQVKSRLKEKVDAVFVPRRIAVMPRLPRDERGKLSRASLERLFELARLGLIVESRSARDGKYTVGGRVLASSLRFRGHFPEEPVYPAVAQLIDLVAPEIESQLGMAVCGWKGLKFGRRLCPGDEFVLDFESPGAGRVSFRLAPLDAGGPAFVSGRALLTTG